LEIPEPILRRNIFKHLLNTHKILRKIGIFCWKKLFSLEIPGNIRRKILYEKLALVDWSNSNPSNS
jgi:hypothetical protein